MSTRNRTATVIAGAAVATALAGGAAFAAVPSPSGGTVHGMAHMQELLDEGELDEMHALMADGASVGSMHRWMKDAGVDLGQMHGDMARSGMSHGWMHRNMATSAR
jgi:hypothetical protein